LITKGENTWTTGTQQNSRYNGPFTVGSPVNPGDYQENSAAAAQSDAQLDQAGTTAIARCEPTNPIFDAATFIGELRDGGIPKAPGLQAIASLRERTAVAKAAGSEYLNVEFGWKPLVSDLRNLSRAVHESHQIMSSYRKGSGKKIRRAFSFPPENSTRQYKGAMLPIPSQVNAFLTGYETSHKTSSVWFSGAFRYWLPTSDSQMNKFEDFKQKAAKLYGARLTPETVWNLTPWSWAADWFTSTGDVLHNISALGHDGLVMQYGYIMAQTEHERVRVGTDGVGTTVSHIKRDVIKQRRAATPYGFGANLSSLSGKQVAVLAALGLSRS
jgi:hypothetical protein